MKISIIIVSYNVKNLLVQCIKSFEKYINNYDYEIIVIDNNSKDNTVQYLKDMSLNITLIPNKANIGFGAANNKAVKYATGDILIFANPDTEIVSSIDGLIHLVNREKNISVVFGKLKYPTGETQEFIRTFPTAKKLLFEIFGIPNWHPSFSRFGEMIRRHDDIYNKAGFIDAGSGAFFIMTMYDFKSIGGFDEDYFLYGEETDLFYRLNKIGKKVYYYDKIEIIHHHGKSTAGNPKMYVLLQKNISLFIKKYYSITHYIIFRYLLQTMYDLSRMLLAFLKLLLSKSNNNTLRWYYVKRHFQAILWELYGKY